MKLKRKSSYTKLIVTSMCSLLLQSVAIISCPTCVGRLHMNKTKQPFFTSKYYQPKANQSTKVAQTEDLQQKKKIQDKQNPFAEVME